MAVFFVINVWGFQDFCNSDVYADMQVAQRMWEQKTLFPDGWIFGNQYYVLATPVLAALFYGLTGNMTLAMTAATTTMTVLILWAFLWMIRPFVSDRALRYTGILLMITSIIAPWGPYSVNAMLFFLQASFYACYLITLFVVYGDYGRAHRGCAKRSSWILSLILCFAMGMQSLRQTVVMVLPVLCCEVLRYLRNWLTGKKGICHAGGIRALSYGVANVAGHVIMNHLHVANASIYGSMRVVSLSEIPQRLLPARDAFYEVTGLDYVLQGNSSKVLAACIVCMILIVLAAAFLWLRQIRRQEEGVMLYWLLGMVGLVGVTLSTLVLDVTPRGIYLFLWFPLVAFSGILILQKVSVPWRQLAICFLCVLNLVNLWVCYKPYVDIALSGERNDAQQLCDWAVENGYQYVYGDYWGAAPEIAVYSNGALEAGCWHTAENVYQAELANTPQDIYGEEENEKAIYVFTSDDESTGQQVAAERKVTLEKLAQFGDLRVYRASEPLMRTMR